MEKKNPGKQMTDLLNSLSGEQRQKLISCKGEGELAACLGELGAALPDELLDQVAGGLLDYEEDPEYVQLSWEYAVEYDRRLKRQVSTLTMITDKLRFCSSWLSIGRIDGMHCMKNLGSLRIETRPAG